MKRGLAFLQRYVVPAVLCFGVAYVLSLTELVQRIENVTLDERTRLRSRLEVTVPEDAIALVGIDETSLHALGRWPWDREVHGNVLQLLSRTRPAVVAWDILFTEATPADESLARAAAMNRAVVFGATLADQEDGVTLETLRATGLPLKPLSRIVGDTSGMLQAPAMLPPTEPLARAAAMGFVDTPPDNDGVRRTVPLVVRVGAEVYPTLSLATLMQYWGAEPDDVEVRLGQAIILRAPLAHRRIPIDASGRYAINYRHDLGGFVQHGYSETLQRLYTRFVEHHRVDAASFTARILLVGQVAAGLTDFGPTPLAAHTPLVLVHGNVIENVLREDYVRVVSPGWIWGALFGLGVLGLLRFSDRAPLEQAIFSIGVPVAFAYVATLVWINESWVVPLVGPAAGFVALQVFMVGRRMLTELRAKEQIKGMFGSYVSPQLVSRLVAAGRPPELGGHEDEITAYFSDIERFSTFSEILSPAQLVELMNEYLTACTDIVQGEGGTLDKYIGDAIVAMFGAPVPLPDHAYRACAAVVAVQARLEELRRKWEAEGRWPEIVCRMRSRIGLNTGPCVIGNMGSRTRFNYTMMGDNVNLAARMESGAKFWGVYAMCTEATRLGCEAHAPGRILFRPLGRIVVKGRSVAVPIHEIAGDRETIPAQALECIAAFSAGLDRYYQRDWQGAAEHFHRSAALEQLVPGKAPGVKSNPSLVYIDLVAEYSRKPPPPGWDGVYVMADK